MIAKALPLAICLACMVNVASANDRAAAAQLEKHEEDLLQLTNQQRQQSGLRPLTIDPWLQSSARSHAAWMTRSQNLQHTSRGVAENIAMGQRSPAEAVTSWMNSPGHRANMLSGAYTRIGVAAYTSTGGASYWCLQFLP